jgi:hypothetical protein
MTKYDNFWKEAIFVIQPWITDINDFIPIMERCYKKVA